jgi:hypothetical protein
LGSFTCAAGTGPIIIGTLRPDQLNRINSRLQQGLIGITMLATAPHTLPIAALRS